MSPFFSRRRFFQAGIGGLLALIDCLVGRNAAVAGKTAPGSASDRRPGDLGIAPAEPLSMSVQTFTYDCSPRVTSLLMADPPPCPVTYVYDARGVVVCMVVPEDEGPAGAR
jgi:hypothetical protein